MLEPRASTLHSRHACSQLVSAGGRQWAWRHGHASLARKRAVSRLWCLCSCLLILCGPLLLHSCHLHACRLCHLLRRRLLPSRLLLLCRPCSQLIQQLLGRGQPCLLLVSQDRLPQLHRDQGTGGRMKLSSALLSLGWGRARLANPRVPSSARRAGRRPPCLQQQRRQAVLVRVPLVQRGGVDGFLHLQGTQARWSGSTTALA